MTLHRLLVRQIRRRLHRPVKTTAQRAVFKREDRPPAFYLFLTGLMALLTLAVASMILEWRLRPLVRSAAETAAQNQIHSGIELILMNELDAISIKENSFIAIETDDFGRVISLQTDTNGLNRLRSRLVTAVLQHKNEIEAAEFEIPLKSLFRSSLFLPELPSIKGSAVSIGTISAEYKNSFLSAGVNQTAYQISLEISAPVTLLLPGQRIRVPVQVTVPIAETVIVGQVPNVILGTDQLP